MNDVIRKADLQRMVAEATVLINKAQGTLSELDSIGGDGDHGTTMLRAMDKLEESLSLDGQVKLTEHLKNAGWNLLSVDGGASSAILATFVAGMGDVELGEECDCRHLAESLLAGLSGVSRQTKARPGDKTMIDALEPAVDAFVNAANSGATIADAMSRAAQAAQRGADGTKDMIARFGRAKFLGERTRGSPDAGATSIALIFEGFSIAVARMRDAR